MLSTLAFVAASYLIKRRLEDAGIPKGMTRTLLVFCLALAIAYGVAWIVDLLV